jgi:hypothetical protein
LLRSAALRQEGGAERFDAPFDRFGFLPAKDCEPQGAFTDRGNRQFLPIAKQIPLKCLHRHCHLFI